MVQNTCTVQCITVPKEGTVHIMTKMLALICNFCVREWKMQYRTCHSVCSTVVYDFHQYWTLDVWKIYCIMAGQNIMLLSCIICFSLIGFTWRILSSWNVLQMQTWIEYHRPNLQPLRQSQTQSMLKISSLQSSLLWPCKF